MKKKKQKRQRTAINFLIIGIALLLILVIAILRSYRIKQKSNYLIAKKKDEIEEKNTQITSSIKYAQRIQEAILPSDTLLARHLPNSYVFYKPKDIVSGDFFWVEKKNNKVLFAVVDCTGHGVPGAFISIVGHNALVRAVNEFKLLQPAAILDKLNDLVNKTLRQSYENSTIRDGMDIALCSLDIENMTVEYAAAFNPLYIIRDNKLIVIKGDKQPVGNFIGNQEKPFTHHTVELKKGDMLYIFSDGYADQFGGLEDNPHRIEGEKFKFMRFKKLLTSIAHKELDEQKRELERTLTSWKGTLDQMDDICVFGVRI